MSNSNSEGGGQRSRKKGRKYQEQQSPLFDELIFAPDREQVPGAKLLLSYDEADDPEFLAAIEGCATSRVSLKRRGFDHGQWAELDLAASGVDVTRLLEDEDLLARRWAAGQPVLFPAALAPSADDEVRSSMALFERLHAPGELKAALAEAGHDSLKDLELSDPRDLAKVQVAGDAGVWFKCGRLSLVEDDSSLRLRVSYGQEVDDDAARDLARHHEVTRLAESFLPAAKRIAADEGLRERTARFLGTPAFYTQHIAFWNAPNGGALLHHDAFEEEASGGQRGVLYVQLSGETAWLALSSADLAQRVTEFAEALEQGEADWVRRALWPDRRDFERVLARIRDPRALLRELSLPGCGKLGPLVNQGPDFTSFLADAGHGFLVRAGDALFMPSHGLECCVMHSVFCASDEPTYAMSLALREG